MTVRNASNKPHAHFLRILLLVGLVSLAHSASPETLVGKVVRVADGDTLTILDARKRQHKVRLDGIDAPERKQAFGKRSWQSLAVMCAGRVAQVEDRGKDQYGRIIGGVTCAGVDVNTEQVRRGMAWVFARYVPVGSPLYELEAYARLRHIGLWADRSPLAPWDWRKTKRTSRK